MSQSGEASYGSFDAYVLLDPLDAAPVGQVLRARHAETGEVVALKILARDAAGPLYAEHLDHATHILAALPHPNLAAVRGSGQHDGLFYLVSEHVAGRDLATLRHECGSLAPSYVLGCMLQAASCLGYMHHQGVCHGNLKPTNLMLDDNGYVKVVGVGLTQHDAPPADNAYRAPELPPNAIANDPRCDVYSLGCTLYTLLTGQPPMPGPGGTLPSLAAQRPDLPPGLEAAIQKMAAAHPDQRYASMAEVYAALEDCQPAAAALDAEQPQAGAGEDEIAFALADGPSEAAVEPAAPHGETADPWASLAEPSSEAASDGELHFGETDESPEPWSEAVAEEILFAETPAEEHHPTAEEPADFLQALAPFTGSAPPTEPAAETPVPAAAAEPAAALPAEDEIEFGEPPQWGESPAPLAEAAPPTDEPPPAAESPAAEEDFVHAFDFGEPAPEEAEAEEQELAFDFNDPPRAETLQPLAEGDAEPLFGESPQLLEPAAEAAEPFAADAEAEFQFTEVPHYLRSAPAGGQQPPTEAAAAEDEFEFQTLPESQPPMPLSLDDDEELAAPPRRSALRSPIVLVGGLAIVALAGASGYLFWPQLMGMLTGRTNLPKAVAAARPAAPAAKPQPEAPPEAPAKPAAQGTPAETPAKPDDSAKPEEKAPQNPPQPVAKPAEESPEKPAAPPPEDSSAKPAAKEVPAETPAKPEMPAPAETPAKSATPTTPETPSEPAAKPVETPVVAKPQTPPPAAAESAADNPDDNYKPSASDPVLRKISDQVVAAGKTLVDQPDDPGANLAMGRYVCFFKGDWEKGLPMLIKGSAALFRDVAAADQANPSTADAQAALADRWYEISQKSPPVYRKQIRLRAAHWYRKAAAEANDELKAKIEARLKTLPPAP